MPIFYNGSKIALTIVFILSVSFLVHGLVRFYQIQSDYYESALRYRLNVEKIFNEYNENIRQLEQLKKMQLDDRKTIFSNRNDIEEIKRLIVNREVMYRANYCAKGI